ncbi:MAG: phage baseplate assembly protein V [Myxococcales bacterium]|nr:phage baseplate assembly protein V [Myxococcota bacterium]MDW8283641.1 phage baseplate assembly protein V [Myxococcales bacterium]
MQRFDKELKMGQLALANQNLVLIGIVSNIVHPQGDYRIKVKFPTLPKNKKVGSDSTNEADSKYVEEESFWCRIVTMGASKGGMGMFFLPEVDDEVLVVFLNGDFNQGFVLGTLWNGKDKPSYSNKDASSPTNRFQSNDPKFKGPTEPKKNDIRAISTRAKHELVFNDNANDPLVCISSGQKHRIVLNDKGNEPTQIEIYDGKEENYILIDTKNKKITMETKTGDILIKAKETIRLEAKTIETDSKQETNMKVGTNWNVKVGTNMSLKAGAQANIESGGTMVIKGATVNIN